VTGIVVFVERVFDWKMPKWAFVAVFGGVFLLVSFFLAWRDQYHEAQQVPVLRAQLQDKDKENKELKEKPAQVQVNLPEMVVNFPPQMAYMASTDIGLVDPKFGSPIAVTMTCKNISPSIPAENATCWRHIELVDTSLNYLKQPIVTESVQDKAYSRFEMSLINIEHATQTYGPGEAKFGSVFTKEIFDETFDRAFTAATKTILVTGQYDWQDGVGKHSNQICAWLQMNPGVAIGKAPITWNYCSHHNGLKSHLR